MIKGIVRFVFFYVERKPLAESLDILNFDFFSFGFNPSEENKKIVFDHVTNDHNYFFHDILKNKNKYKTGIYELIGIYRNYYVEDHRYYDPNSYLDWEISKIKILKYNKLASLDLLENLYISENPYFALYLIESLRLSKYLNKNRKLDCSIKSNSLFKD